MMSFTAAVRQAFFHRRMWRRVRLGLAFRHNRLKSSFSARQGAVDGPKKRIEIDNLGTWDSRLDFAINEESSLRVGTIVPNLTSTSLGVCTNAGRRSYQEDRFTILNPAQNMLMLAVWDGHGGSECSDFCSQQIGPQFANQMETWRRKYGRDIKMDLASMLNEVVLDLNQAFERHWIAGRGRKSTASSNKSLSRRSPGTTATIALIRDNYELVLAHVGDSRAILCRGNEARSLTKDHCPSRADEKQRIEANGGTVTYDTIGRYMVNKRLSMSRSIGDLDLKEYGVTADPDVSRLNFKHGKDKFLVLTTDGINFVMSDEEIVNLISTCETPSEAADRLIDQALLYASEDNVTVIVLPLGSWGKGENERTSMLYSLGRNMALTSRFS